MFPVKRFERVEFSEIVMVQLGVGTIARSVFHMHDSGDAVMQQEYLEPELVKVLLLVKRIGRVELAGIVMVQVVV